MPKPPSVMNVLHRLTELSDTGGGESWTLAVQWHPEDLTERALFDAFARAVA